MYYYFDTFSFSFPFASSQRKREEYGNGNYKFMILQREANKYKPETRDSIINTFNSQKPTKKTRR